MMPCPIHLLPILIEFVHFARQVFHPPGGIRPEVLNTPEIKDLIDINFSDTNILDSPNFGACFSFSRAYYHLQMIDKLIMFAAEIGRKIPVMLTGILNRTGVDVFQEERNRENQSEFGSFSLDFQ